MLVFSVQISTEALTVSNSCPKGYHSIHVQTNKRSLLPSLYRDFNVHLELYTTLSMCTSCLLLDTQHAPCWLGRMQKNANNYACQHSLPYAVVLWCRNVVRDRCRPALGPAPITMPRHVPSNTYLVLGRVCQSALGRVAQLNAETPAAPSLLVICSPAAEQHAACLMLHAVTFELSMSVVNVCSFSTVLSRFLTAVLDPLLRCTALCAALLR